MSSVNKVIIIGNLGKDPEVRATQDGKEIANLTVATSESWKDKATGERKEKTEWHRVVIFNEGLVEVAKRYLNKGSKIYIEGALQTRKWTDQTGAERYSTEVVIGRFKGELTMLDGRKDDAPAAAPRERAASAPRTERQAGGGRLPDLDDEVPFTPCWQ